MYTHYQTLQIRETATTEEIRRAYRTLVLKYHPDRNPEKDSSTLNDLMSKINEAYRVLIDPVSRSKYNMELLRTLENIYKESQESQARKTTYSESGIDFRYIFYAAAILLYALVHLSKSYTASVETTQSVGPKEVTPDIRVKEVFKPQVKSAVESIYHKK